MGPTSDGLRELRHKRKQTGSKDMPGVLADVVPPSPETPAIPESVLRNPKRKRGPTKLKTIAIDGHCRVGVLFDDNGQPIGEGSVKLSSFLGALDREIVPYAIGEDFLVGWQKSYGNPSR